MTYEFSDEEAYEAIEELRQAAALADSEPMEALFSDAAALVAFLMKERDCARATLRYCEGKWSEERGTMLDRIQTNENALSEIIGADHHNHSDGPPPRYVEIARSALRGRGFGDANDPGWDGYGPKLAPDRPGGPNMRTMWAEVEIDVDTGERVFRLMEADNRDGAHFDAEIVLSADTFPVGTKIEIREPDNTDS